MCSVDVTHVLHDFGGQDYVKSLIGKRHLFQVDIDGMTAQLHATRQVWIIK